MIKNTMGDKHKTPISEGIAKENRKLGIAIVILIISILFAAYVIPTHRIPFYGSISERELQELDEKYADYIEMRDKDVADAIDLENQKIAYRNICTAFMDSATYQAEFESLEAYGSMSISENVDLEQFASALQNKSVSVTWDGATISDPSAINWCDMHKYDIVIEKGTANGEYSIIVTTRE